MLVIADYIIRKQPLKAKDSPLVQVEVGSVLRLDCPVSQLVGGHRAGVMLWKKGHRVLTAGTIKVGPLTGQ